MRNTYGAILAALRRAREIVVFSGAGLSADSGIPTFRDGPDGLWADIDPQEVVSVEGFARDPDKVWRWHQTMRQLFAAARPNPGHTGIFALEALLPQARVTVVTQNIDGLHQAAGSTRVFEVHGSAMRLRCHRHCGFIEAWDGGDGPRACPRCGQPARPDVVWFGEALEEDVFTAAVQAAYGADLLFTVGTSAVIQPAASLPVLARQAGALVVEVNPCTTPFSRSADHALRVGASEFFPELLQRLALA